MRFPAGPALFAALLALGVGPASRAAEAPPVPSAASVLQEARDFMTRYAADLRSGDRLAIPGRYAPEGAIFTGGPSKTVATAAQILERYRTRWRPPTSFDWCDLSYEVLTPDSVAVTGFFRWGASDTVTYAAYTGLLVRRDGRLAIRLEHENVLPPGKVPPGCSASPVTGR